MVSISSDPHWQYIVNSEWRYDAERHYILSATGTVVADLSASGALSDQDRDRCGWLLASAPDLFKALDSILSLLETHASHIYYRDAEVSYADDVFKKATGQFDDDD